MNRLTHGTLTVAMLVATLSGFTESAHARGGFALASIPTLGSYYADVKFSYNTAGNYNQIIRDGVGQYRVIFIGVNATWANAQVVATGTDSNFCTTPGWSPETVWVNCFNASGQFADTTFVASLTDSYSFQGTKRAYLFTANLEGASYGWSSGGTAPIVTRENAGAYHVIIPQGGIPQYTVVSATPKSDSPRYCKAAPINGSYPNNDLHIDVHCYTHNGIMVDSQFSLIASDQQVLPANTGGWGWRNVYNNLADSVGSPSTNVVGSDLEVTFNGLRAINRTAALVTASTGGSNRCKPTTWYAAPWGGGTRINVRCFDAAGAVVTPGVTGFNLMYQVAD